MLRSEIVSHLFLTLIYFALVSFLRFKFDLSLLSLWLGAILGMFLLDLDHLIYFFFTHPEAEDSKMAREIWEKRGLGGIGKIIKIALKYHKTHHHLIFHTATFQIILFVLSFYILISGGSLLGSALVISANLHLLKDEWFDLYQSGKANLTDWLFWQIRGLPVEKYLKVYLIGVSLFFLVLTYFLI